MAKIKILALDGGGIRGIIPATILAEIEKRAGKPISALFDLLAGTSTGGILALGLAKPGPNNKPVFSASDMVQFYFDNGPAIFASNLWHKIGAPVADALGPKFPAKAIESILWAKFGDMKLSDSLTHMLIPAYDLRGVDVASNTPDAGGRPVFFSSTKAQLNPDHYDFFAKDVARATSAAPTYFEPYRIQPCRGGDWMEMVDGGLFANNPAMCAYVEAVGLFGSDNEFTICSIGTGELNETFELDSAEHWGELAWIQPVLKIMMDGVGKTVDHQLQTVLPYAEQSALADRYFRLQPPLTQDHSELSDANEQNMDALKQLADQYIAQPITSARIAALCRQLAEDMPPHPRV